MTEVTQERFFEVLKADKRDIMPRIVSSYPYTSDWQTWDGFVFGKTVDFLPDGRGTLVTAYYLSSAE